MHRSTHIGTSKDIRSIPLSVPHFEGNEWEYVKQCLDSGWVSSAGSFVDRLEEQIAEFVDAEYAVGCMNGTAALHTALLLTGVKPGDYVIVPNFTFVASINVIKYAGADPILVDADPDTWQLDLGLLEEFLATETHQTTEGCIHTATERYQELGAREDTFAEPSKRYSDFHSAIHCMLDDCAFERPKDPQRNLFEEI